MEKPSKKLLEETEKLSKENKSLKQQLRKATKSADAIKTGNIDALVVTNKKDLTIYTETTADKTYRILIERMHEGALMLNEDGIILYSNSYFAHMVNLPLQKVIGAKFKKFNDDFSKDRFTALLQQGREIAIKEEVNIYTGDGTTVPVLISVTNLPLDNSSILSIILTDLTIQNKNKAELKRKTNQLEEKNIELEDANKDLTSFTHVSSHDLQEPLRKIQNFVSILLEEEKNLSETGKGYFRRMAQTANRMQTLIDDLLIYSRAKSSERIFKKTDLAIIIDEVKKDYEELILEKKATIEVGSLSEANIIPFQFRQLMQNLISNSLKYSKPETAPHITIKNEILPASKLMNENPALPSDRLTPGIDYCHITYTDNGIGFDPQYKDRIFQVFQRLHNREAYEGTGIGLAICKRVVENHNGIITATGKLNKGARFDIYIPVHIKNEVP